MFFWAIIPSWTQSSDVNSSCREGGGTTCLLFTHLKTLCTLAVLLLLLLFFIILNQRHRMRFHRVGYWLHRSKAFFLPNKFLLRLNDSEPWLGPLSLTFFFFIKWMTYIPQVKAELLLILEILQMHAMPCHRAEGAQPPGNNNAPAAISSPFWVAPFFFLLLGQTVHL